MEDPTEGTLRDKIYVGQSWGRLRIDIAVRMVRFIVAVLLVPC
jgi:hypothetical protein